MRYDKINNENGKNAGRVQLRVQYRHSDTKILSTDELNQILASKTDADTARRNIHAAEEREIVGGILERGRSKDLTPQRISLEQSPWDKSVKELLLSLPQHNEFVDPADFSKDVSMLEKGIYEIKEVAARGAESVLYRCIQGESCFCVKSIRNWLDKLLGDPVTNSQRPLLENVRYGTKCRHIKNEYKMAEIIGDGQIFGYAPVKIYSLIRKKCWGLEIGYDLVMEYVNGFNFSQRQLVQCMTFADKLRACYWMATVISYLHIRKIVHLDIKPSNFMIDVSGKVRIIDFGVSVASGTTCRAITGTMGYLSPEQIARRQVDAQTDIFALGVVFAVIFGGKPLPQTIGECSTRRAKNDAVMSLNSNADSVIMDIPELNNYPELQSLIRRCCIPNRHNRIRDCQELMVEFRQFAENHGIVLD